MSTATILGLDASSTAIGWAVLDAGTVRDHGCGQLTGRDINERCRQAQAYVRALLRSHPDVDCVAIESPVARFAKAVIPQALVSGAIRAGVRLDDRHVVDVPPQHAKRALSGKSNADKAAMQRAAVAYGVAGEHAADALGVALAAVKRVQVEVTL
jgi:Holliday junction resolvasome RuvABC endonuclease subunit